MSPDSSLNEKGFQEAEKIRTHISCQRKHGIKVFNYLPTSIKNTSHDIHQFRSVLKSFLLINSFYSSQEYFSWNFNRELHFLNIVSLRWCPLSTHSHKRFWKFCIPHCNMVGEIAATSSLMFYFKSTVVPGFFSYTVLLNYPQSKKSQALRSSDLAGHSIVPLREIK